MSLTRKLFIQGAIGSVGAIALGACGDDSGSGGGSSSSTGPTGPATVGNSGSGSSSSGMAGGCTETIGTNHGHVLTVSEADVMAAQDKDYDIAGSAGHSHMVTITAADFATLAMSGGMITVMSTTGNAHTHSITVTCA